MNNFLANTCKLGQGLSCCRYLVIATTGFECVKLSNIQHSIDFRVATGTMTAQGNNCDGLTTDQSIKTLNEKDENS